METKLNEAFKVNLWSATTVVYDCFASFRAFYSKQANFYHSALFEFGFICRSYLLPISSPVRKVLNVVTVNEVRQLYKTVVSSEVVAQHELFLALYKKDEHGEAFAKQMKLKKSDKAEGQYLKVKLGKMPEALNVTKIEIANLLVLKLGQDLILKAFANLIWHYYDLIGFDKKNSIKAAMFFTQIVSSILSSWTAPISLRVYASLPQCMSWKFFSSKARLPSTMTRWWARGTREYTVFSLTPTDCWPSIFLPRRRILSRMRTPRSDRKRRLM